MEQLADDERPTKEESDLLINLHDDSQVCREKALMKLQPVLPDFTNIVAIGMVDGGKLTLQLVKRKITWGSYNQQRRDMANAYMVKIKSSLQQIGHNLAIQNRQEIAERNAAINAPLQITAGVLGAALTVWGNAAHAAANSNQTVRVQTSCTSNQINQMTFTNCY